jgi:hypothetical protein
MQRERCSLIILLGLAVLGWTMPGQATELKEVISGKKIPFVLQLKSLGDDWRRISLGSAGGGETGAWMQFVAGGGISSNVYYTRGETVPVEGKLMLVAYRPKIEEMSFVDIMSGKTPEMRGALSAESLLTLSLINLETATSLDDIRPFNLQQELEESKKQTEKLGELTKVRPGPGVEEDTSSLGNLKQLALALLMYADDYDEMLPDLKTPENMKQALLPYLRDDSIFSDPAGGKAYGVNSGLSQKNINDIAAPADTVVFYETRAGEKTGLRGVAFLDGHTQLVDDARWQQLKTISHLP